MDINLLVSKTDKTLLTKGDLLSREDKYDIVIAEIEGDAVISFYISKKVENSYDAFQIFVELNNSSFYSPVAYDTERDFLIQYVDLVISLAESYNLVIFDPLNNKKNLSPKQFRKQYLESYIKKASQTETGKSDTFIQSPQRYFIKLSHGKKDYYLEWSTVVDAPTTNGMNLEEFRKYYKKNNDRFAPFEETLKQVDETGCSAPHETLESLIRENRAGENGKCLSKQELIDTFCLRKNPR